MEAFKGYIKLVSTTPITSLVRVSMEAMAKHDEKTYNILKLLKILEREGEFTIEELRSYNIRKLENIYYFLCEGKTRENLWKAGLVDEKPPLSKKV